jgi:putative endonuclease
MYYIYVMRSQSTGRLYIGHTDNIQRRLIEHNSGMSKSTKGRGPWELIYQEEYTTRGEAMKREYFLKSGKGREILKGIISKSI